MSSQFFFQSSLKNEDASRTGRYKVQSIATDMFIGQDPKEILPMEPKKIVLLSEGVRPPSYVLFILSSFTDSRSINSKHSGISGRDQGGIRHQSYREIYCAYR